MELLRYAFSIGRFVFTLSILRMEKKGSSRKPATYLKLSRKLRFLRGHALRRHPSYGGAREVSKRYKYYKERQQRVSAGSARPGNNSHRRAGFGGSRRRSRNHHAPPQLARKPGLSVR